MKKGPKMPLPLKDIKGLMIDIQNDGGCCSQEEYSSTHSFNSAVEEQGNKKIGLNREKLIDAIHDNGYGTSIGAAKFIADAIIANEKDIIEVKE